LNCGEQLLEHFQLPINQILQAQWRGKQFGKLVSLLAHNHLRIVLHIVEGVLGLPGLG
jgi:hypothetical protein